MSRTNAAAHSLFLSLLLLLLVSPYTFAQDGGSFFRPAQNYNAGNNGPVAVADVNGDGKPDLMVGNETYKPQNPGSIDVLLGNGDGTFQPAKAYATGSYHMNWITAADVNGDSRPDLLVALHDGVAVLMGNGDGSFGKPTLYPIVTGSPESGSPGTTAVTAGDINGDGIVDLLVAIYCIPQGAHCFVGDAGALLGKGDGTFGTLKTFFPGGFSPGSIVLTDVNHDGKPDLLVYNGAALSIPGSWKSSVGVMIGDGAGGFQRAVEYDAGGDGESAGGVLAVVDMNSDGNLDLVTANSCVPDCGTSDVGVLLGRGDGTFEPVQRHNFTGGYMASALAVADINRDGRPDVLVAHQCYAHVACDFSSVGLLLGRGDGSFLPATSYALGDRSYGADRIAAMDVNGDGTADVFVTSSTVSVLLSLFATTTNLNSSLSQSAYGQSVTLTAKLGTNGPVAPSGTVLFLNGKVWIASAPVVDNVAWLTTSHLPAGTLSLTAVYRGDDLSTRSTSAAISQIVAPATTITAIHSSLNPSPQGQPVKFTATVTSPTVKVIGTVTFMSGATSLGTVGMNSSGQASVVTSALPHGRQKITAVYNGTSNITGSIASITQTIH